MCNQLKGLTENKWSDTAMLWSVSEPLKQVESVYNTTFISKLKLHENMPKRAQTSHCSHLITYQ